MSTFTIGQTYASRWRADYDCVFKIVVLSRTQTSVKVRGRPEASPFRGAGVIARASRASLTDEPAELRRILRPYPALIPRQRPAAPQLPTPPSLAWNPDGGTH